MFDRIVLCCTFSRVSTVFFICVVKGRCWHSSLISRTSGQFWTGRLCAEEPLDLVVTDRPRPRSEPNVGPWVFFWKTEKHRRKKVLMYVCIWGGSTYVDVLRVPVFLYLYSGEVMPGAVPQVGRCDVRALFPLQPLGPHTWVARF